jgi:hypothetical protein
MPRIDDTPILSPTSGDRYLTVDLMGRPPVDREVVAWTSARTAYATVRIVEDLGDTPFHRDRTRYRFEWVSDEVFPAPYIEGKARRLR